MPIYAFRHNNITATFITYYFPIVSHLRPDGVCLIDFRTIKYNSSTRLQHAMTVFYRRGHNLKVSVD